MALDRRDQKRLGKGETVVHRFGQAQKNRCFDPVDLVDRQHHLAVRRAAAKPFDDLLDPLGHAAMRLDQQDHDIGVRGPAPGGGHHGPVKAAARREKARRVNQHDLRVALDRHAANARPRGLDLVGDDRHFRPDHGVGQGRLACIGLADQGGKSGAFGHRLPRFATALSIRWRPTLTSQNYSIGIANQQHSCARRRRSLSGSAVLSVKVHEICEH